MKSSQKSTKKPLGKIDHIVVAADSLAQGVAYMEQLTGVTVPPGGEHTMMGTHNCLMNLGPETYFEIIAVNPDEEGPAYRRRWFNLDDPAQIKALKERPRLLTWVVGIPDSLEYRVDNSHVDMGEILYMTRGDLEWHLTVKADGSLPEGGTLPTLIKWPQRNPARDLPDLGCRLKRLRLHHPEPELLNACLDSIGLHDIANVGIADNPSTEPYLEAILETPKGPVVLR